MEYAFPDGTRWLLARGPSDSPDGSVEFVVTVPPGVFPPPPHIHRTAYDCYEVLDGRFDLKLEDKWQTLSAGERLDVPPGTMHTLANRSSASTTVRNTHRPASGFDEFVAHADRLMRERGVKSTKDPRLPILFSMLTLEYPQTFVPGRPVDRLMTHIFAKLGRLLGMSTD